MSKSNKSDKSKVNPISFMVDGLNRAILHPNISAYQPHEKQLEFHKALEMIRLYIGGNRSGKTTGGITEDIYWMKGEHPYRSVPPPPTKGRICAVDFLYGIQQIIFPVLAQWIPPSLLINGSWEDSYDSYERVLTCENGSTVEFKSYDQPTNKFAGTSRHWCHEDEESPEDIHKENMMRLIDTGGSCWLTLTPVEGMTWIYDAIYLPGMGTEPGIEKDPNIRVIEVSIHENPFLSPLAIQMVLSQIKDEGEKLAREQGKFVQIGGLIYPRFNSGLHVIDNIEVPAHWPVYESMDHGLRNPTAWGWYTIEPDAKYPRVIKFDEYYESEKTVDYHARQVFEKRAKLGRVPEYTVGDPSIANRSPTDAMSVQQLYIQNGIIIQLGNHDFKAGINRVRGYLTPQAHPDKPLFVVTRNCENTIREMSRYRWKRHRTRQAKEDRNQPDEPSKINDHTCDETRYFLMSRPDVFALLHKIDELKLQNPLGLPFSVSATGVSPATLRQGARDRQASELASGTIPTGKWEIDEYTGGDW